MQAVRLPYPRLKEQLARELSPAASASQLGYLAAEQLTVAFPERGVCYLLIGCTKANFVECVERLCVAVDQQPQGSEPPLLEIRLHGVS